MSIDPVRTKYVSAESLGRSSVAGGVSLFPPCLMSRLPCRAINLHPTSYTHAARPRPNALTLHPGMRARFRRSLFGRGAAPAYPPRFGLRRVHLSGVRARCVRPRPATLAPSAEVCRERRAGVAASRVFTLRVLRKKVGAIGVSLYRPFFLMFSGDY